MALAALLWIGHENPAQATNMVLNGGFESLVTGSPVVSPGGYICQLGKTKCTSNLANWSSTCKGTAGNLSCGTSGTVASILFAGTNGKAFNGGIGLASTVANSPTGGNFLAIDGDPTYNASISQSISGLKIGSTYILMFYMAAAQQKGTTGPNTEWWDVTFGAQTIRTTVLNNPSQGFTPWIQQVMTFKATSTTQTLTFLAGGTPNGGPPVVLLDGVFLDTPEPGTFVLLGAGLIALSLVKRKR